MGHNILMQTFFVTILLLSQHSWCSDFPNAVESDPKTLGWMEGFPPPKDKIIKFEDGSYFKFPEMRWSVANFRQLMPTVNIEGASKKADLKISKANFDINSIKFKKLFSKEEMTWNESLLENYTDGIIVLHRGEIIYEKYFGILNPEKLHGAMSITKTFVGTLAAELINEGIIKKDYQVSHYVPELKSSALGSATIQELQDMTTGIRFSEDYSDPNAEVWKHAYAGNPLPKPQNYNGPRSYYDFLKTLKPEGKHSEGFHYRTVNTDALGWVISRATGKNIAELLSEKFFKKMGSFQDAYMSVDSIGTPFAGGGLSLSLRDLALFGEMIRRSGSINGHQILNKNVVKDILKGGDKKLFAKANYPTLPGWSYHNMWWISHNSHNAIMARGVHGQALYIDPKAELIIARFASHPIANNSANDPTTLPAFEALAQYLIKKSNLK